MEDSVGNLSSQVLEDFFRPIINDLRDRVDSLKAFDPAYEINMRCDDLESQVILSVQSAIQHLNEFQHQFLSEISSYRNELLTSLPTPSSSPDQHTLSSSIINEYNPALIQHDLQELAEAIERFSAEYSSDFHSDQTTEFMHEARVRAETFRQQTRDIRRRIRARAFGNKFMKFNVNHLFSIERDSIGTLEASSIDDGLFQKRPCLTIEENRLGTLTSNQAHVVATKFLTDDVFMISSADGKVKMLNLRTKNEYILLREDSSPATDMIELPGKYFCTGDTEGNITVCSETQFVAQIQGHRDGICALKSLGNGRFASLSFDDTIKVWDFHNVFWESPIVMTGHGCSKQAQSGLGSLSNGYLVTCSYDPFSSVIKLWDPKHGRKVSEVSTNVASVIAFTVLENDEVAFSAQDGSIHVMNLFDPSLVRTIVGPKPDVRFGSIAELRSKHLIAADYGNDPSLYLWDLPSGKLLQKLPTNHSSPISTCALSAFKMIFVTGSSESIKFWTIF